MVHTKDNRDDSSSRDSADGSYQRKKRWFVPEIIEIVNTRDNRDDSSSRDSVRLLTILPRSIATRLN